MSAVTAFVRAALQAGYRRAVVARRIGKVKVKVMSWVENVGTTAPVFPTGIPVTLVHVCAYRRPVGEAGAAISWVTGVFVVRLKA